jgi:sugar lactone lactonase YvrE
MPLKACVLRPGAIVLAACCVFTVAPAPAQVTATSSPASPRADSAQRARAAYRRAMVAYGQHDTETAHREMLRAAEAWPTQQVYLEAAAKFAAMAGDTADAVRWVDRLAQLGIGNGVRNDTTFRALIAAPAFAAAAARLDTATAPVVRSRVRLTVADTTLHPEGIAFESRHQRWFMGSVRQRRVIAVERDGTVRDFIPARSGGLAGVFGMAIDSVRRMLWVATTALPRMDGFTTADRSRVGVYGYDLETGRLTRKAWMPRDSSAAHTFGDVAVAPNGDVYVSDSQAPWIFRLPAGGDTLVRFVTDPLFRSLQGMAITLDGETMYVADYSHGLIQVSLSSRTVTPLGAPDAVTLLGVDGLYWHRGALIGVQNGVVPARVVRFCLDSSGRSVRRLETLDRNPAIADEPTLGAIAGDSLFYVATSEWEKYDDNGKRIANTRLRPATVLALSLDSRSACRG